MIELELYPLNIVNINISVPFSEPFFVKQRKDKTRSKVNNVGCQKIKIIIVNFIPNRSE